MLNLNTGFNLNVLPSVDGRKVTEIRRASNEHSGRISILRFRKLQEVPNIIIECEFDDVDKFFLQFEHLKTDEIMQLYTMVSDLLDDFYEANAATSNEISEWLISLKEMALDGKPKLSAPLDDEIKLTNSSIPEIPLDHEEIARLMEEAFDKMDADEDDEDEDEEGDDITDDQRFTADFFDFCEKDSLHFFRLLQMTDYLSVIKDALPVELKRFNYLAFISLSFIYDEYNGTSKDISPSVRIWGKFHNFSKKVIGDAIGEYNLIQTIQSVMETLDGYKARNWTRKDVEHIDELLDEMKIAASKPQLELVFDSSTITNKDEFTLFVSKEGLSGIVSELFGNFSGKLHVADFERFLSLECDKNVSEFVKYVNQSPLSESLFYKN